MESLIRSVAKFINLVYKIILIYINVIQRFFAQAPRKSVKNQNVLITGSGHGLGRELALKFAKLGANLVLVDINVENNDKVKIEVAKLNPNIKILTYSVDIREYKNVSELAANVARDLGDIDILINNAGIVQCQKFLDLSPSLVERTFQVNTLAHIWTIKHFLPSMIKNQRGHVVAVASLAGLLGGKYLSDYCASKFAVVGLMESLDKEIHSGDANENIHFTTICPASMSTGMFQTFTSRFSWILPVLSANSVSSSIIDAVLTNETMAIVPAITHFFFLLSRIIPSKANNLIQDYLDYGVKPHRN